MTSPSSISTSDIILRPRDHSPENASLPLHCCCGSDECILLRRNYSIFRAVEKDVQTAAQLGQALLSRHKAYMADAERERLNLTSCIERLEMDKHGLEIENANKIEENRNLLEQLDTLNNSLSDFDVKIRILESSLLSSQQAVRRLEAAATRAEDAERHLAALEVETDRLLNELRASKDDARIHTQRFKEAQRGIMDMQDQLERLEDEARQERKHHAEIVERIERQREIEKQLDAAAGRLKGAAATKSLQDHQNGSKIVGHFVRDLLQDNANLQLGIAEMREMLMNSNDEIQSLRDELLQHQPLMNELTSAASALGTELEPVPARHPVSHELHIHHHYHVASKNEHRKLKKKRQGLLPGIFTTPTTSTASSPRRSSQWRLASSPTAPAFLGRLPDGKGKPMASKPTTNWDEGSQPASDFSSSVPSSPPAHYERVFDTVHHGSDPPTSPTTSFEPLSPAWQPSHCKRQSVSSTHSFQSLTISVLDHVPVAPSPNGNLAIHSNYADNTILEEDEDDQSLPSLMHLSTSPLTTDHGTPTNASYTGQSSAYVDELAPRRRLQRVSSHESIMSLTGGLDIHTLKSRPSQMTLRPLGGADAVLTGVIAHPTLTRSTAKRSDAALRDNFAGFRPSRIVSSSAVTRMSSSPSPGAAGTLGKLVGWRPWGGGSVLSPQTNPASRVGADANMRKDADALRVPGINQPGAIPGFPQYWTSQKRKGAPAKVTTDTVDHDALTEILQE